MYTYNLTPSILYWLDIVLNYCFLANAIIYVAELSMRRIHLPKGQAEWSSSWYSLLEAFSTMRCLAISSPSWHSFHGYVGYGLIALLLSRLGQDTMALALEHLHLIGLESQLTMVALWWPHGSPLSTLLLASSCSSTS